VCAQNEVSRSASASATAVRALLRPLTTQYGLWAVNAHRPLWSNRMGGRCSRPIATRSKDKLRLRFRDGFSSGLLANNEETLTDFIRLRCRLRPRFTIGALRDAERRRMKVKSCSICGSDRLELVDADLAAEVSYAKIAAFHGFSKATVGRHALHSRRKSRAEDRHEETNSLRSMYNRVEALLRKAERSSDLRAAVSLAAQLETLAEKIARARTQLGRSPGAERPRLKIVFENPLNPNHSSSSLDEIISYGARHEVTAAEVLLESLLRQVVQNPRLNELRRQSIISFLESWAATSATNEKTTTHATKALTLRMPTGERGSV
jgi:hypothetical protein